MIVKIMRGLPGSGKTTYVTELFKQGLCPVICSADIYRLENGVYVYKKEKNFDCHAKCFDDFMGALRQGKPLIVVDNTNTDPIDIAPYHRLAEYYRYHCVVVWMNTPVTTCYQKNVHNASLETLVRMSHNLAKPMPDHWKVTEIKR